MIVDTIVRVLLGFLLVFLAMFVPALVIYFTVGMHKIDDRHFEDRDDIWINKVDLDELDDRIW